jgi:peptidoglycan-associated lipoprotein
MRPTLPLALLVPAVLAGCASQQTVDAQAESVSRQLDAQASTVSQQIAALKQAQTSMAEAQKNLQARLDKLESQQSLIATRLNQESTASAALQHDVDSLRNQTSTTQGEVAALSGQVSSQTSAIAQATSAAGDALRIAGDSQVAINSAADRLRITEETIASQTLAVAQAQDTANNALKIARESEAASSSAADKLRTTEEIVSSQNRAIAQAEDTANDAVKIARDSRLVSGKVVESLLLTENMVSYSYEQPELTSQGRAALDTLIAYVKPKLPHVFVEIIGYTDSLSLDSQNRRIALERAESVRRYLHETGGIPLDRMSTISYGDLKPVASNTSFEGRVQNRRVLVQVLK